MRARSLMCAVFHLTVLYTLCSDMKVVYKRDEVIEYVPDSELDREVEFVLSETETIWLLDMPSVSVLGDSEEATIVLQRNRLYQEVLGRNSYMYMGGGNKPYIVLIIL